MESDGQVAGPSHVHNPVKKRTFDEKKIQTEVYSAFYGFEEAGTRYIPPYPGHQEPNETHKIKGVTFHTREVQTYVSLTQCVAHYTPENYIPSRKYFPFPVTVSSFDLTVKDEPQWDLPINPHAAVGDLAPVPDPEPEFEDPYAEADELYANEEAMYEADSDTDSEPTADYLADFCPYIPIRTFKEVGSQVALPEPERPGTSAETTNLRNIGSQIALPAPDAPEQREMGCQAENDDAEASGSGSCNKKGCCKGNSGRRIPYIILRRSNRKRTARKRLIEEM